MSCSFRNVVFSNYSELRTMDRFRKLGNSEHCTPSSESFRTYKVVMPTLFLSFVSSAPCLIALSESRLCIVMIGWLFNMECLVERKLAGEVQVTGGNRPLSHFAQRHVTALLTISYIKKNCMVWVRERTIPTERPPLVGEVIANFCG
jgi:hypothetical protein